jgi:thiamine biosynthesis protein ThiS
VRVLINGEAKDVPAEDNLTAVLQSLELPTQRVAVELNKKVIRRADWENTPITEGDEIEVVHFVGGG